jgi:hypothetical protein
MTLRHETLEMRVGKRDVEVDALFDFTLREGADDMLATFPVAPPCGAPKRFRATLEGDGLPSETLDSRPAADGMLPAGDVRASFDIVLPIARLRAHGGRLRVRYQQRCDGAFGYVLRTGAYWHGPIGELAVAVHDPNGRVTAARVEDQPAHRRTHGTHRWHFRDVEPRHPVKLNLLAPR